MKKYILIAGVNGAGKSTLYQTLDSLATMPRINTDEIAKKRIAYRVSNGGHGIPDEDVERRYAESFRQLREILGICDTVILYDNTEAFKRLAIYKQGKLINLTEEGPDWYKKLEL